MNYPNWLSTAIIYQIYPASFNDSNGDGIGDIQGIISKLDHIKSLGVTAIWLSPCFDSPFEDGGYDIKDFYQVAPRYGTNHDLIELFEAAKQRDIRVILDLVAGHTSIEHPWFQQSALSPTNPEADRYIWMNRDFDPQQGPTDKNYLHNFFWYQPALNFGYANPTEPWQDPIDAPGPTKNRNELKKIMAYWMDLGAAGFRVDMAASMIKNDPSHRVTIELWKEIRSWMDTEYPNNILIAEWSHPEESIEAGFHLDFLIHFNCDIYRSLFFTEGGTLPYPDGECFFNKNRGGKISAFFPEFKKQLESTQGKGLISLPTGNHDIQRLRCGPRGWEELPVAWVFLMTQPGPPTIYMGDEIGMRFVPGTPPKEGSTMIGIVAPNAGADHAERSGTRTPLQWSKDKNDGFSTAKFKDLYLPIDTDPERPTVEEQENNPDSLLHFVRKLIQIRQSNSALQTEATYNILNQEGQDYPLIIERKSANQRCLIILNPLDNSLTLDLYPMYENAQILLQRGLNISKQDRSIILNPFAYGILESSLPL